MIIRVNKKDDPYVRVDKYFINDPTLSLKAKGIMTYLLSKPDGWHVRIGDLVNQHRDGSKAVRSGVHELIAARYMAPDITRCSFTGRVLKYDYTVSERPLPDNGKVGNKPVTHKRKVGKRKVGKRKVGNRVLNNKLLSNSRNQKINKRSNNNNTGAAKTGDNKKTIITIPIKQKRKFNTLKKKILNMGWIGSLDEVVKLHNEKPEYVKAWVERINKVAIDNQAGLLRKSLRSGDPAPTSKEEIKNYLDDPLAEFIED